MRMHSMTINCRGKLIDLSSPKVMGILNITPDSFHDGGQYREAPLALNRVEKMLSEGVDFIDIGGMSSRPGAEIISAEEELSRIMPLITGIVQKFPEAIISVDTLRAKVAKEALEAGTHIINDISAGRFDNEMIETVAKYQSPYIIMHMQGLPADMQVAPHYGDVVIELYDFFLGRIKACHHAGIIDTIIDPGFGFGKNIEHNYTLLRNLSYFANLQLPILAGVSRKSMICRVLGVNPDKALNGTTAVNMLALMNGAQILRVHDVKEAKEVVKIFEAYKPA
jgi:dihydropteroate synthase